MLPELAWSLKPGDPIVSTGLDGTRVEGTVEKLITRGMSTQDYLDCGLSFIDALRLQHDGPTVVLATGVKNLNGDEIVQICRPDDVERLCTS